ncbi:MAG: glycosyltransferase family 39 protein [Flavobacteriaceae bacterium]|nr:glycosyltransferase family 39 protein [Flavobacteriaceae bacterium]
MKKYIVLLVLLMFAPILFSVFSRDASVYAYMGSLFFEHKIPYVDAWDHKGIAMYLINAIGYLLGGQNFIGIRVLELLLIAYAFIAIYKSLCFRCSKSIAFVAITFGLLTLSYFFDGGNLTEEYGVIFVLIALSRVLKPQKSNLDWIIVGALFVINFTIRANLITFWIALFIALLLQNILKEKSLKKLWQPIIQMSKGVAVVSALLGVYFTYTSSFDAFYHAAFSYNFSYSSNGILQTINVIIKSLRLYEVSFLMILSLVISLVSIYRKRIDFITLLLLFWIPLELYFVNMSGKMFGHYYMMWVPIIILAMVYSLEYFKVEHLKKEPQIVILVTAVYLFFQVPIFNTVRTYKRILSNNSTKNELVADHLNANYQKASILVWGNECAVYTLTHKHAPVKNFYQTIFKIPSAITKELILDFTNEVIHAKPEVIVDIKTPSLLFLDQSNSSSISDFQKENLKAYFTFVEQYYTLSETYEGADFYTLK